MLPQRPEQSLQELAAPGTWKHHLCNSLVSEGLRIHDTRSWLPKAVMEPSKAKAGNKIFAILGLTHKDDCI